MRRALLLVMLGTAALTLVGPVQAGRGAGAGPSPDADSRVGVEPVDNEAAHLLAAAAEAVHTRNWSGTQRNSALHSGALISTVVHVDYDAGAGTRVGASGAASASVPVVALDPQLLALLMQRYRLSVAGVGSTAGRWADVVEARRTDAVLAARFWFDQDSGLPLRRELYDSAGRFVRGSTVTDLATGAAQRQPTSVPVPRQPVGRPVAAGQLAALRHAGWPAPNGLPGGFSLFDVRLADAPRHVLHLAYSDGLSTQSVFVQQGSLGGHAPGGFIGQQLNGRTVLLRQALPEQVIWQAGGHVFTLVSDADPAGVAAAVGAFPPAQPAPARGLAARFGRGLARVASWVSPLR